VARSAAFDLRSEAPLPAPSGTGHPARPRARIALLCLALAACAPAADELAISADGIGPLRLGVSLADAARAARRLDPIAAGTAPGCDERDQLSVILKADGVALAVMAMADGRGIIEEVLAMPAAAAGAVSLPDASACRQHGAQFASQFARGLGAPLPWQVRPRPVSEEFVFPFAGDARVVARWFAGGKSCDLLLQFGSKPGARD
jgi:hypothetical protein